MNHTPGPWQLVFSGVASTPDWKIKAGTTFKESLNGELICSFPPTSTSNCEQVEANARLIASAPELLEALQNILAPFCLVAEHLPIEQQVDAYNRIQQAKNAIATATGD